MVGLAEIKQETDRLQALASHSGVSAWVSANAGTGKTYVLVQRVLRLLLTGAEPERILCLTFTKAAASEMANRLFDKLGEWATAKDEDLKRVLYNLLGHVPGQQEMKDARRLFARALETPGGLKVQTIHAFCEKLLKRFPLEAGVAPHFAILDTEGERELRKACMDTVFRTAVQHPETTLGQALLNVIAYAGEERFDDILRDVLGKREVLRQAIDRALRVNEDYDQVYTSIKKDLCKTFMVPDHMSGQDVITDGNDLLDDDDIDHCVSTLLAGKKSDQQIAEGLLKARNADNELVRFQALCKTLLTANGEPRSDRRFITKQIREDRPDIVAMLCDARDTMHSINAMLEGLKVIEATASLIVLADAIMQHYVDGKTTRSALDFDDLIIKSANLLNHSDMASWVLYKLDGGIDHILVDEAQDTSPQAWSVIVSLAEEFFSGYSSREELRTVFAVGDEKQSIYGFQGAEPKKFAEMGRLFEERAKAAELEWHRIPLTLSFRTTTPVLNGVDHVFRQPDALQGLTAEEVEVAHYAFRDGQAGLVEIWDTEQPEEVDPTDPWEPTEESRVEEPTVRLANKIADQIAHWLDTGEKLGSRNGPITAGDIIILVRKRNPFVTPMIRALKSRNIPVAGADRIKITEQLAVMDLMALGDFLLMPEDDLSLATVLKSPFFDFTDDDLLKVGYGRKASLWEALTKNVELDPRYDEAVVTIKQWLARADLVPPYEFFAGVLLTRERRSRIISRLGPEAGDAMDEFLNMAIQYDDSHPPSLQGFLSWMHGADTEIKRDMEQGRNEVRIMTVHGAKGLEAEIVFMPDTCSTRGSQTSQSILEITPRPDDADTDQQLVWSLPGTKQQEVINEARGDMSDADREEYNRLLYVAMTRARDRLYVCGFESKRGRDRGCWYDLVFEGLSGHLVEAQSHRGETVWRLESSQADEPDRTESEVSEHEAAIVPPEWASRRAPAEPTRSIPVTPSHIVPLEVDEEEEGEPVEQIAISPGKLSNNNRFLRGQLTHALLEHLPDLDPSLWQQAAERLVNVRGAKVSQKMRDSIVKETMAILNHAEFGALFGPDSQSEVSLVAKVDDPAAKGKPVTIAGQVDRMVILDDEVLVVDYKTNRPPPTDVQDVAESYVMQLVAYKRAILEIFPNKSVRCALLWTDGPNLMEIPSELLTSKDSDLVSFNKRRT